MFITITRAGGARELRVLASAIAYIDEAESFTLVKLISGEALRADEDRATLEQRIDEALCGNLIAGELLQTEVTAAPAPAPSPAPAPTPATPPAPPPAPTARPATTPKSKAR